MAPSSKREVWRGAERSQQEVRTVLPGYVPLKGYANLEISQREPESKSWRRRALLDFPL